MGISSLGVGSSILTQDVLDQLRKVDESQRITPITLNLANENDKKDSLKIIDATMTNFRDAINELKTATAFDARKTTVSGSSVEISASENSDIQEFTLDVQRTATKEIVESAQFGSSADKIATDDGYMEISIGGVADPIRVDYTSDMTLSELKKSINDAAGDYLTASLINVGDDDTRLVFTAKNSGDLSGDNTYTDGVLDADEPDITIEDKSGFLSDDNGSSADGTNLTSGVVGLQSGEDSLFEFNGQAITRSSNQVDDLITGYKITLKEIGSSSVNVEQDREKIETKIDSFVEKYNSIITEIGKQTLSSTDAETRGIFSGESSVKSMKRAIEDMISTVSGDGGSMVDYGFEVDKDGKMSIDKTIFNTKLDENPSNVKAFFQGGDFTKTDNSVVTLTGAFSGFYDIVNGYVKTNGGLDQVKESISQNISAYEERKERATERLDAKYEIMKKQYTAYNSLINKFNSSSNIFTQLANAQNN